MHRVGRWFTVIILELLLVAGSLGAAPEADLWSRWERHDPAGAARVDHAAWDRFLSRYLVTDHPSRINRVRYGDVTAEHRRELDSYIGDLQAVAVSELNRDEQEAFWINLYNALTVKVILDHYPVSSITKIDIPRACSAGDPGTPSF